MTCGYVSGVDLDPDLATAIASRKHWRTAGVAAIYSPPGSSAVVRVQPRLHPAGRERYRASIIRNGRAEHSVPAYTAIEAVVL